MTRTLLARRWLCYSSMLRLTSGGMIMFCVQCDAEGQLMRVEATTYAEATQTLPADRHEIQAWYANEMMETSLKQLKQSDLE